MQPLIKEFSATSFLNWDTAHTAVIFVFSSLVLEPEKPECSLVDLLSYESKTTEKRELYGWRAEKNLDGLTYEFFGVLSRF